MELLVPGSTCWKITRAKRLSLLRDAGPTFAAMATAMEARHASDHLLLVATLSLPGDEPGHATAS